MLLPRTNERCSAGRRREAHTTGQGSFLSHETIDAEKCLGLRLGLRWAYMQFAVTSVAIAEMHIVEEIMKIILYS